MALNDFDDFRCIQFNIPFHKDCPDFIKYIKNIRKIQEETQTDLQILQIVRIKGNEKGVEEARRRVSQLNDYLAQNEQQDNKDNMFRLLKDIQNKIFESEREKGKMTDAIQNLKARVDMDYIGIKNDAKTMKNKFQEEIEAIKNNFDKIQKDVAAIKESNPVNTTIDAQTEENDGATEADFYRFVDSNGYSNHFTNFRDDKPLHIASALGRLDIVKRLLKKGGSVNHKSDSGITPLYRASEKGHLPVVRYLIEKGAYIDAQNQSGQAALYVATCNQHRHIVEYLCSQKASVNLMAYSGYTALTYAQSYSYTRIQQILEIYVH